MEVIDSKRKRSRQFVFIYIVTVALIALSFVAFLVPNSSSHSQVQGESGEQNKLLGLYDTLNKNWSAFLQFRQTDSSSPALIEAAENRLKIVIDSVEKNGSNVAVGKEKQSFEEAISTLRLALMIEHNHNVANTVETDSKSIGPKTEDPLKDDHIATLEQKLKEADDKALLKDNRIKELEGEVLAGPKAVTIKEPAKNNSKVEQENEFLKWAIRSQVTDLKKLTDENNTLKQANVKLAAQLAEAKKNS